MIGVLAEECFGRKKSLWTDPLDAQTGRSLQELKETVSHDAAPPAEASPARILNAPGSARCLAAQPSGLICPVPWHFGHSL